MLRIHVKVCKEYRLKALILTVRQRANEVKQLRQAKKFFSQLTLFVMIKKSKTFKCIRGVHITPETKLLHVMNHVVTS